MSEELKNKKVMEIKKGDIFEWNKDDNKIKRMLFINVNFIVDIDNGSNFAMGCVLDSEIGKVIKNINEV